MDYPVTLTNDEGTVLVTFPDFPEGITYGEDREDALMRASDALETVIIGRMTDREEIPAPSKGKVRGLALHASRLKGSCVPVHVGSRHEQGRLSPCLGLESASSGSPARSPALDPDLTWWIAPWPFLQARQCDCGSLSMTIIRGSDNVLADLGIENADQLSAKIGLAVQINKAIEAKRLTQAAAKLLRHLPAEGIGYQEPQARGLLRRTPDEIHP